ncbi:AAA family ATPase [Geoalkalibacter halelectricus]|uniref:AAA family ATPase n=1 Tax=Geoalkalibacter halelectricus TaxID=2847045 RepID=UPI003D1A76D7
MISDIEQRLAEFVDREDEMRRFLALLEGQSKSVMVVTGGGGVGKSSLLARMIHECALRRMRKSEIIWTETRNHDYMGVMRKIRDDIGPDFFKSFTDLINFFTVPQYELKVVVEGQGGISVAQGARIEGSQVGDVAGILIKDLMLSAPRNDMAVPESERMARLTDAFLAGLATNLDTAGPLLVFLDATEKMSQDTERWIWGELLAAVRDGRLRGAKFVLSGRRAPELGRDWLRLVEEATLRPLDREHILVYLERRGVAAASRAAVADILLITTQGNVLQIATYVDAFLQMQEEHALA